ncbi:unnamed protein product [Ostreobium quekettii]|uniref:Uncharacterized protein n=1 Tax=Ostreobium quekettii TaxID=121088 RepID=A0A8S1IR27_9CHLO|nr:unnamed protein product [Ostreobium quekettii]
MWQAHGAGQQLQGTVKSTPACSPMKDELNVREAEERISASFDWLCASQFCAQRCSCSVPRDGLQPLLLETDWFATSRLPRAFEHLGDRTVLTAHQTALHLLMAALYIIPMFCYFHTLQIRDFHHVKSPRM